MILRELFVKLGLSVDEASFAKGQLAAKLIETGLARLVHIAGEAVETFAENAKEAIEYGDKIKKASQSIGIATDALQELQYAGSLADVGAEDMAQTIGILSRKMHEAKQGSEATARALKGIAYQKDGKFLATEEVLGNIADKFKEMPDGAEKTAMAMELFGRSGKKMIPLLNKGSEELDTLREEARAFGLVIGEDAVDASEELNDNLKRLHDITLGLWRQAIAPLIPYLGRAVKWLVEWRKESSKIWSARIQRVVLFVADAFEHLWGVLELVHDVLKKVPESLRFLWHEFMAVKIAVAGLAIALIAMNASAVRAALSFGAAWAKALLPFTLLYLILDDIAVYMKGGDSLIGRFAKWLKEMTKPEPDDWWITKQIKEFFRYIMESIELLRELDEVFGNGQKSRALADRRAASSKQAIQQRADTQTLDSAKNRLANGLPLTKAEREALQRSGISQEAFTAKYTPAASAPEARVSSSSSSASINAPVSINVTQAPGQSGKELAEDIANKVKTFWNNSWGAVSAGVNH